MFKNRIQVRSWKVIPGVSGCAGPEIPGPYSAVICSPLPMGKQLQPVSTRSGLHQKLTHKSWAGTARQNQCPSQKQSASPFIPQRLP